MEKETKDLELRLFPVPQSAGVARTFVGHHLAALGYPELVDDACVIASELVTNALAATPGQEIRLWLRDNGGRPLLQVWDASPKPPSRVESDPLSETGRGLVITNALAAKCGFRPLDDGGNGKIVWALLR